MQLINENLFFSFSSLMFSRKILNVFKHNETIKKFFEEYLYLFIFFSSKFQFDLDFPGPFTTRFPPLLISGEHQKKKKKKN
jgi:hypothetical protein